MKSTQSRSVRGALNALLANILSIWEKKWDEMYHIPKDCFYCRFWIYKTTVFPSGSWKRGYCSYWNLERTSSSTCSKHEQGRR